MRIKVAALTWFKMAAVLTINALLVYRPLLLYSTSLASMNIVNASSINVCAAATFNPTIMT